MALQAKKLAELADRSLLSRDSSTGAVLADLGRQEAEFKTGVPQVVGISTGEVGNLFAKSVNDMSYQSAPPPNHDKIYRL